MKESRERAVYSYDGCMQLIGAILAPGKNDPDFWREPCINRWTLMAGLDPDAMQEIAARPERIKVKPLYTQCYPRM